MDFTKEFSESKERSRLESIYWAGALIWGGLVFSVSSLGYLPQVGSSDAWAWVLIGVGLYGTLMNIYATFSEDVLTPRTFDYVWSGFWLAAGLSGFITIDIFWPVVILMAGVSLVIKTIKQG